MLRSLALAAVAVLLGAVAGCGGGGSTEAGGNSAEQYCSSLRDAQKEFGALESGDVTGTNLDRIFDRMHGIADQAPPAVADEWKTLDGAISQMESGLKDLGLSFKDLSNPKKLQGVDPQKLQQFGQDMQKIGGQRFQQAGNAIEKHAQQECGIKLGQG
jgi:hypothetical protein